MELNEEGKFVKFIGKNLEPKNNPNLEEIKIVKENNIENNKSN